MRSLRRLGCAFLTLAILALAPTWTQAAVTLLVSSVGSRSILQYDGTSGAFIRTFATSSDLDAPFQMTYGPDGNLYVVSLGTSRILRYNGVTGAPLPAAGQGGATFIPDTSASGGMQYPNNLLFTGGKLFVTDFLHDRVLQFDATSGAPLGTFISGGSPALTRPTGMVFDGTNFYVATSNVNDQILEYTAAGVALGNFPHNGTPGKVLIAPAGLVIQGGPATEGTLFASSFNNTTSNPSQISAYRIYTGNQGNEGKVRLNITDPSLNGPAGLTIGPNGDLFVGNSGGNSILEFNPTTGAFVTTFVAAGSGGLSIPTYMIFTSTASAPSPSGGLQVETPEPSSLLLLGMGTLGLLGYGWHRCKQPA